MVNQFLAGHINLFAILGYVVFGSIANLPTPQQHFDWYTWFYNTARCCLQMPALAQYKSVAPAAPAA